MMALGMFMAILDIQVVATSLPTIQSALGIAPELMSWIQTAYLIAEIIAIPLTGVLTRLFGMRWLFIVSITVFTIASAGCAASTGFGSLIFWRVVQGFSGGSLIPAVFSAVFLLFPVRQQGLATTIAGVLAVLAPTIGPVVGGWVTESWSWHMLFLINILPGIVAALAAGLFLPRSPVNPAELRRLDFAGLLLLALALAALEIGLKEAPGRGWLSGVVVALLVLSAASAAGFAARSLTGAHPIADLRLFRERNFLVGCIMSFALGVGLFGSVYLMPVFLAFVRGHGALEIGRIMLVTGATQLVMAPIAVQLDKRLDPRLLSALGFLAFASGLALSGFQTPATDYDEMFWPQVVRGAAIMFCLLPPTRLALGLIDDARVPDASGLFNLMRNLGGAIGIALIDTVLYGRAPLLGDRLVEQMKGGSDAAAGYVGIPLDDFAALAQGSMDIDALGELQDKVEKAALAMAANEAWLMLAGITLAAMLALLAARRPAASA
ncbi:MFS transporter [Aestuariivirga litoralis]|uniref:MFS transporter n=1 Tax=Aestuariivirga litoralis TaxID=2650924 RepID=A0A2W2AYW8_9HYPH|nr:DHA2 family efflux MFS transporter permease subunit [Aestuariivirga litoralis]PZF78992.1 MFS transporter [Aestuariivirga litoralis]